MPDPTPSPSPRRGRPRGAGAFAWRAFFHQSATPVFVLGATRRLRYANPAWERLAGTPLADALGLVCSGRPSASALAAAMAPTPDALAGRPDHARRAAPPHRHGPPWWDVTFAPLAGETGLVGVVGFVAVVGEAVPAAARKITPVMAAVRDRHAHAWGFDVLAGESLAAGRLVSQVRAAAASDAPVWLRGEAGGGKRTAARVVHHNGPRREKAFLGVDCEGLQPYLLEGVLFGHGGLAGSDRVGTVYLREPAALPRDLQQRFLDWFADARPGGPRPVCASVRPALDDVTNGRLLPAFYTTLAAVEIVVPPLRDRPDDLPRLVSRLLERSGPAPVVQPAALEVLKSHPWPGNVRELADVLTAAATRAAGGPLTRDHLPHEMRVKAGLPPLPKAGPSLHRDAILEEVERRLIETALARANADPRRAAELLGVTRAELTRRMKTLKVVGEEMGRG